MAIKIDEIRELGDFAPQYEYEVLIKSIPALAGLMKGIEAVNLRIQTINQPKRTSQTIDVDIRGHKVRQPGIYNYGNTITINLVETVDNYVMNLIRRWREACMETETNIALPKGEVETEITINKMNRQKDIVWSTVLHGCFLEDYEPGDLDGATSDVIKPTMTISYDYFDDSTFANK